VVADEQLAVCRRVRDALTRLIAQALPGGG